MIMPDSEAKKKWDKQNVIIMPVKLFRTTDTDIISFLDGKVRGAVVKSALREYIENHKGETE